MLYALLCGFPPFYAREEKDIKKKILKGKVKFDVEIWENISLEARDLITKMLVPEQIRPSARECLEHPWFTLDSHQLSSQVISVKTFERLKAYSRSSMFRQSVHYIIAYRCQISEDDAEKFRKMFRKLDNGTQGYVTL